MPINNNSLKTYDFNQVAVNIAFPTSVPGIASLTAGATRILQGFADGTVINATKNAPSWNYTSGNDGEGVRSRTNDESWQVVLTLLQTSDSNALLSAIHAADLTTGRATFDLSIRDLSGTTVFDARECFISAPPNITFGREAENREWTIACHKVIPFIGGN